MSQKIVAEIADFEQMREAFEQLKRDVARLESMLPSLQSASIPVPGEDIFAEMADVTAHAPHANDSREAIYTRMPGE